MNIISVFEVEPRPRSPGAGICDKCTPNIVVCENEAGAHCVSIELSQTEHQCTLWTAALTQRSADSLWTALRVG